MRDELGDDYTPPDDDGPGPDPDDVLAAARSGIEPAGIDWTPDDDDAPPPTPEQRTENWQTLIRGLFDDKDLREWDTDRKVWQLRVSTARLVEGWLAFPGERIGTRPSMYRLMKKYEKRGLVIDTGHGEWLISAALLDEPLDLEVSEEDDVDAEEAALRHQLGMLEEERTSP
jgi:hypothetical protein